MRSRIAVILKQSIAKRKVSLAVGIAVGKDIVPQLLFGDIMAVKIKNKGSLTKFDKSSRNSTENAIILGMNYLLFKWRRCYNIGVV